MKTSEKTDSLIAALLKARAAFPVITKDKTAKVPTKNGGQYQYNYADLSSIIDGTKEALLANGLLLQHGMESNGHTVLTCRLSHITGQWQESAYPIHGDVDAQAMGSAITYGRRYTACAMLGIVTEDDDDGASAQRPSTAQAAPAKITTRPGGPVGAAPKPAPKPDAVGIVAAPDDERPPLRDEDNPEAVAPIASETAVASYILEAYTKERNDKNGNVNRGVLLKGLNGEELGWHQCYEIAALPLIPKLKGKKVQAKLTDEEGFKTCSHIKEAS